MCIIIYKIFFYNFNRTLDKTIRKMILCVTILTGLLCVTVTSVESPNPMLNNSSAILIPESVVILHWSLPFLSSAYKIIIY